MSRRRTANSPPQFNRPSMGGSRRANQRNPSTEWLESNFRKNEAQVARNYSQTMARENFFSHTGPDGDTSAQGRSAGLSYRWARTCLRVPTLSTRAVSREGWMNSQGIVKTSCVLFSPNWYRIWRDGNTTTLRSYLCDLSLTNSLIQIIVVRNSGLASWI